jgi:hypothetical protein
MQLQLIAPIPIITHPKSDCNQFQGILNFMRENKRDGTQRSKKWLAGLKLEADV